MILLIQGPTGAAVTQCNPASRLFQDANAQSFRAAGLDPETDFSVTNLEIGYGQWNPLSGEAERVQRDLGFRSIDAEPQRRLELRENHCRRPGMQRVRRFVPHWRQA